jgi:polysaccharide chain length determinant protein (PEP-CTERM system associated)
MLGQRELNSEEYFDIWRRRKAWFLVCLFLGPIVGYGLTLVLPAKYMSSTLVLVEQPKVPDTVIKSVVSDALNQRLVTMQEQILSRTRLQPLIERFNLYASDQRNKVPMEELVATMRKNIKVEPIKPTPGATATPASPPVPGFTISFTSDDPKIAQQVCGEITSMFMEENLKIREQRAQGTTDFLAKNLEQAKLRLDEQDGKMAEFKRRYAGQLPGQELGTTNVLMSLRAQLDAATSTINRTQQDKAFAESQLAQEQANFEASQSGTNPVTLEQQLNAAEAALNVLEGRYTPDHPDVIKARGDVAQLKKKIEEASKQKPDPADPTLKAGLTPPPQLQQLRTLLHTYDQTLQEKTHEQQRLQEGIKVYQSRLELSPLVEEEYKKLTRDYGIAVNEYNELLAKKNNSELSTDLERRQQGEQFRVMDPPNLPEEATFPNPIYFTLGGIAGGVGLGAILMVLVEMRDKALRSERDIEFFLELPTLALLPSLGEKNGHRRSFWMFGKKRKSTKTASPLGIEV